jgi:hypothetical protein
MPNIIPSAQGVDVRFSSSKAVHLTLVALIILVGIGGISCLTNLTPNSSCPTGAFSLSEPGRFFECGTLPPARNPQYSASWGSYVTDLRNDCLLDSYDAPVGWDVQFKFDQVNFAGDIIFQDVSIHMEDSDPCQNANHSTKDFQELEYFDVPAYDLQGRALCCITGFAEYRHGEAMITQKKLLPADIQKKLKPIPPGEVAVTLDGILSPAQIKTIRSWIQQCQAIRWDVTVTYDGCNTNPAKKAYSMTVVDEFHFATWKWEQ